MEKILAPLLKENYTPKDLVREIRLITTDIKKKKQKSLLDKTIKNQPDLITSDKTTLDWWEAAVEKLPRAIITLAIALPKTEINRLGQWFRRNVNSEILLEIRQDPQIIGGCQIIWQGREGDFSLRRKFEKQNG
jgi:F0F1-type ATP synthase delta subunit